MPLLRLDVGIIPGFYAKRSKSYRFCTGAPSNYKAHWGIFHDERELKVQGSTKMESYQRTCMSRRHTSRGLHDAHPVTHV